MVLSDISVKRPVFAAVIAILLAIVGLVGFLSLSVREYPDVDPPVVSVDTVYTGCRRQRRRKPHHSGAGRSAVGDRRAADADLAVARRPIVDHHRILPRPRHRFRGERRPRPRLFDRRGHAGGGAATGGPQGRCRCAADHVPGVPQAGLEPAPDHRLHRSQHRGPDVGDRRRRPHPDQRRSAAGDADLDAAAAARRFLADLRPISKRRCAGRMSNCRPAGWNRPRRT